MAADVSRFYKYGFLPELIARFQRIIPFKPLDEETLKSILDLKLKEIKNEYLIEGFKLIISNKAKDFIVEEAKKERQGQGQLKVCF